MSDMMEYKCPACGGAMEFDSKSQKMKCPYCDTEIAVEEFQKMQENKQQTASDGVYSENQSGSQDKVDWQAANDNQWAEGETDGMRVYVCESCGGEIIAEETTGATTCPYCGNRVVMKGQFTGDQKPDYVIPFKKDKKAAKAAYYSHLKGKPFLPKVFKDENHIDEIKGVYVPFWLFDADTKSHFMYDARNLRVWESGDTEYMEHEHYLVERGGSVRFERIPADGSEKMDDTLMESIEPFDFSEAVPFTPAYLAGFVADRYDVDMEECLERAKERITSSAETVFGNTVTGYQMITTTGSNVNIYNAKYLYALYPVWILNTTWEGKKYTFAMNGQTGKMVGDLPMDKKAYWRYVATRSVIFGVIISVLMWIFML